MSKNKLVILQLSDIHFMRLPDARDEYAQMRQRMYEKLEDICKDTQIDCVIICGDVAFSGNEEEYNQKAKVFINKVLEKTSLKSEQVFMVPGNHDKNREAEYLSTRGLLRDGVLYNSLGAQHFFDLYKDENDVFEKWLRPFEAYIKFAYDYRCVSSVVLNTITNNQKSFNDQFYWYYSLDIGKYKLKLHGINSCYGSDKDDGEHDQILPKELYHTIKNRNVINVSIMHHPLEYVNDRESTEKDMDNLYPIQFYGHIHRQSIEHNGALKIYSGAFMPPKKEGENDEEYRPIFNIIECDECDDGIVLVVNPYKWKWIDKEDGMFETIKSDKPYHIKVDDNNRLEDVNEKPLKLPKGVTQRSIEIDFLRNDRSDEIMQDMYKDMELHNDPVLDASTFFERLRNDDRYEELYNYIHM